MPDLHARLLAEIERRETCEHCKHRKVEHFGEWCRAVTGAVTADGGTRICGCEGASHDDPVLAYLAALRAVVELHRAVPVGDRWVCDRCDDANRVAPGETCAEIAIVATALDVTP